ncbi:hypothetical protein CCR75_000566 [Bremia lactucae]|uniref:Uncharacterized protein n=1 Tax=Bremia lactucae TaxID=4779 RepID=A0A976NZJ4_BRELC|nr:hypothetical protein CCR75_000566 [Bremia lactucae]
MLNKDVSTSYGIGRSEAAVDSASAVESTTTDCSLDLKVAGPPPILINKPEVERRDLASPPQLASLEPIIKSKYLNACFPVSLTWILKIL